MFERYTVRAKRALFFARYEASKIAGGEIEPVHLLLGLLREDQGSVSRVFVRSNMSASKIMQEVAARIPVRERLSHSVELPFSAETRDVLRSAAEQSDLLGHHHIGTEHLLLGILCQPQSLARTLLAEHGIDLERVRQEVVDPGPEGD